MLIVMPLWLWLLYAPFHLTLRATCWLLVLGIRATVGALSRIAARMRQQ